MFYLTLRPVPERNKLSTTFGRVIEGLDVLQALRKDDVMQTFRVLRKRDHDYVPVTTPVGGATAATPETTGDADDIAGDAGDDGAEPVTVGNAPGEGDDS